MASISSTAHPKPFQPMNRQEELRLLRTDDRWFSHTTDYLEPLIAGALAHFVFSRRDYQALYEDLISSVPLAARRFLRNPKNLRASYKFSTYFSWYISQGIDRHFNIRRVE